MKMWILVAAWICSVAIHYQVTAINDETYDRQEPIIKMHASGDGELDTALPLSVVGMRNQCLEAYNYLPKLADCKTDKIQQKWLFYADNTIRPQQNENMCLTSNDRIQDSDVLIVPCSDALSANKLWHYSGSNDTIKHLSSGLLFDVARADPPQRFILWPSHGGVNQKWYVEV